MDAEESASIQFYALIYWLLSKFGRGLDKLRILAIYWLI
jgi:hypothetical protein